MSPCNTFRFRLFVVSLIIVLSTIDTPVAFTLHRTASGEPSRDLAKEENVTVEVKNQIKTLIKAKEITNGNITDTTELNKLESNTTENPFLIESTTELVTNINRRNSDGFVEETTLENTSTLNTLNGTKEISLISTTENDYQSTTDTSTSLEITTDITLNSNEPELTTSFESEKLPQWKKYTTINRKRQRTTRNHLNAGRKNLEEMTKSETKRSRISLQDAVTSDIPSLEQLKNELLFSTSKEKTLEVKDESVNLFTTDINELEITTSSPASTTEEVSYTRWETVESKRAGYLDLSQRATTKENLTAKESSSFKSSPKETLRSMFEMENGEIEIPNKSAENEAKSQGLLNDDTIKEELLKEKIMNENKEIAKRVDIDDHFVIETPSKNEKQQNQTFSSSEDKLTVKPINSDKIKNISLYSVSPNYKPLKKIEVQPPKQFIRDPDDNTWRNESLNSLGIVFKSKNSSKPFTQVLKSKTEAELNSLSEKDSKNDIPDLRERLQKIAEKRKSKRKKTDSLGNVVYFDYEESSGSREHTSKEDTVTILPEKTTTAGGISSMHSSELPATVTTSEKSTTNNMRGKMRNLYSTNKFKNLFNIPEYYDTTEDEDTDYLNMAKIDIKKFSTSTKTTPSTSAPATLHKWGGINRFSTISPDRKATIQYFPPLTTQKVNINDYDNDFKLKVNSYTTNTDPPKNFIAVPLETPKPRDNTFHFKQINSVTPDSFMFTSKPNYDKDLYSTQPPQTTQSAFTLLNEDGTFDRDSYAIRNYKDFINEAAKANEFDKNLEYIPYTQSPEKAITKAELIKYVTEKAKVNMDQEYDYETQFRKDVLQRFVDNFNQNSERFKSDFPILFNNSVIHRDTQSGRDIASSRAFMRGLYNTDFKSKTPSKDDPNNENITLELSPSYELHYYMPEQEEKEEVVQQPVTLPYQYRL